MITPTYYIPTVVYPRNLTKGPHGPVQILQYQWEFSTLLSLYKDFKPPLVLEIGTAYGGTLYWWLKYSTPGSKVVTVDSYSINPLYGGDGRKDNRDQYEFWRPEETALVVLQGDSNSKDLIGDIGLHGPYDWVFIDAGHSYEEVRTDWETCRKLTSHGGIIAFHDILEIKGYPQLEVHKLWKEIRQKGYPTQEIIADAENQEYGGIGVVYL